MKVAGIGLVAGLAACGVGLIVFAAWWYAGMPRPGQEPAPADTDGVVPLSSVCKPDEEWTAATYHDLRVKDGEVVEVMARIEVNDCKLDELGAGSEDRRETIAHERAHARGLSHFEGSPFRWSENYNPAFWPRGRIEGE